MKNKKIRIYVDIVGDLFHVGHLNLFKQARAAFNDPYLIVGVHSDNAVASYKRTPVISQTSRYEVIRNCRLVDEVIEGAPLVITADYISKNNIDFVVHGNDVTEELKRQHYIPNKLGIVKYVEYTQGISTSLIIERIKDRIKNENY